MFEKTVCQTSLSLKQIVFYQKAALVNVDHDKTCKTTIAQSHLSRKHFAILFPHSSYCISSLLLLIQNISLSLIDSNPSAYSL